MAKGKVEIDVAADTSKAKGEIGGLASKVKELGSGGFGLLKSGAELAGKAIVAGGAAAGAAVLGIGTAALNAYKEYEQLVGGVDTLFGSASGKLQGYAADAYRTAGMSANQYMQQATSFSASLVSSLKENGKATAETYDKAADAANMAMIDMSDNVNKMGSNMTDVQNAYQGFAKQNYTMLDNLKLGYGGTKEEMQRLIKHANDLRVANGKAGDLTIDKFSDVVQAIHEVQDEMGITGTTTNEAMSTIEGSIGMASAAWENWLTGLGRSDADMGQLTNQLLESIGAVATNVAPRVAEIGKAILEHLPGALSGMAETLGPIFSEALASAWNGAVAFLGSLGIELPEIDAQQVTDAFATATKAVSDFIETAGPVVSGVINGIISGFGWLADTAGPVIEDIGGRFSEMWDTVGPVVDDFVSGLQEGLGPAAEYVASAIGPFFDSLMGFVEVVAPIVLPIIEALITGIVQFTGIVITGAGQIVGFITGVIETVAGFITGLVQFFTVDAPTAITSLGEWFMSLPETIGGALLGAITAVGGFVTDMANKAAEAGSGFISSIGSGLANLASSVGGKLSEAIGRVASWATDMATKASNAARDFKDKLLDGFANAGSWLVDSGKAILDGLGQGISSAIKGVTDIASGAVEKIRSFFPFSPAKRGPFSGRGYTTFSGRALMGGFAEGIDSGTGTALDAVAEAIGTVQEAFDVSLSGPELAFSATGHAAGHDASAPIVDAIRGLTERVDAMEYNLGPIIARNAPRFPSDREMQRMVTGYVADY